MISLNGHPFQPAALQQYLDQASAALTPGSHGVVTAAVDNTGQRVALVFANDNGNLKFGVAIAHDTTGNTLFGASGSVSF